MTTKDHPNPGEREKERSGRVEERQTKRSAFEVRSSTVDASSELDLAKLTRSRVGDLIS